MSTQDRAAADQDAAERREAELQAAADSLAAQRDAQDEAIAQKRLAEDEELADTRREQDRVLASARARVAAAAAEVQHAVDALPDGGHQGSRLRVANAELQAALSDHLDVAPEPAAPDAPADAE
jgi:hypothetical protein